MKVGHVEPFVQAAKSVFEAELGITISCGEPSLDQSGLTADEITVLIGIAGEIEGTVLYGADREVAERIADALVGEPRDDFDAMCVSAVAELGNIISGHAARAFERAGAYCTISPPTVIMGAGTRLSSVEVPLLAFRVDLNDFGAIRIALALCEKRAAER